MWEEPPKFSPLTWRGTIVFGVAGRFTWQMPNIRWDFRSIGWEFANRLHINVIHYLHCG
jgi:hypothetical protein